MFQHHVFALWYCHELNEWCTDGVPPRWAIYLAEGREFRNMWNTLHWERHLPWKMSTRLYHIKMAESDRVICEFMYFFSVELSQHPLLRTYNLTQAMLFFLSWPFDESVHGRCKGLWPGGESGSNSPAVMMPAEGTCNMFWLLWDGWWDGPPDCPPPSVFAPEVGMVRSAVW